MAHYLCINDFELVKALHEDGNGFYKTKKDD